MVKFTEKLIYAVLLIFSFNCFSNPTDFRDNAALVIIDMQPRFATRGGNENDEGNKKKLKELIKNQLEAIKIAKTSQIPIIFIEYEGFGDTNEELKKATEGYTDVKYILKDSDGMLSYDNSHKPELAEYLSSKKIGNLIITGANGGACVQESITSSLDNNYNVISYSKGIADFNFKDFIYPYVHPYKVTPSCEDCKLRVVKDLEVIALELATQKSKNKNQLANQKIDDSKRELKQRVPEIIRLNDQQKNAEGISK